MTLHEALQAYYDNVKGYQKFREAKDYLKDAALGDPSHQVKANGKTIRVVEEHYTGYDIPKNVKQNYKKRKVRYNLEIE